VLCFIVFAFLFLFRIDFIYQKEGLHLDEVLSIIISSYSDYGWREHFDENTIYTGKQIKELSFGKSTSVPDALADVKKLYKDNRDRPHTNLFYSCFRLWFAKMAKTDLKAVMEHGCKLNLVFFFFSFLFMYKLLRRLFNPGIIIPFSLFISFANTGSISNTLFMRPYQLQEMLMILFTYEFVRCHEAIENRTYLMNVKSLFKLTLIMGLTLLSGYFATIYVLMLLGILAFYCWKTDQRENLKFVGVSFLLSISLARLLFAGFFYGYTCGRAGEAYKQFSYDRFLANICVSSSGFYNILHSYLFNASILYLIFFISIICLVRYSLWKEKALLIFLACIVWSFGNILLAPFKDLRYIMSCFPLMMLIFPFIILPLRGVYKYGAMVIVLFFMRGLWNKASQVDNLFMGQVEEFRLLSKESSMPILILNDTPWKYSCILHQVADSQCYNFLYTKEKLKAKLEERSSATILFSDDYTWEEVQELFPRDYRVHQLKKIGGMYMGCECKSGEATDTQQERQEAEE
jgi:hypothetical protein